MPWLIRSWRDAFEVRCYIWLVLTTLSAVKSTFNLWKHPSFTLLIMIYTKKIISITCVLHFCAPIQDKVFETDKKTALKMDGATLSFSSTGAKLGAVLSNGTYIWNTQTGTPKSYNLVVIFIVETNVFAICICWLVSFDYVLVQGMFLLWRI